MTTGNKRYPTRTHEVLGVEVDEEFEIIDYPGVTFLVPENGWMYVKWPSGKKIAGQDYWASAINQGITRRPRLTADQVEALTALCRVFGCKWLVYDEKRDLALASKRKPSRAESVGEWDFKGATLDVWLSDELMAIAPQDAPLDIVATLKAAGVEVE